MTRSAFQFGLRGIFAATFWAAVSMFAWVSAFKAFDKGSFFPFLLALTGLLTIFVAVGALFGRALAGLLVGIGALVLSCLMMMLLAGVGFVR